MATLTKDAAGHQSSPTQLIGSTRLLPVIVVHDASSGEALGNALLEGGLTVAEVTFRTAGAAAALERMAGVPGMCVGAGTVVDAKQVDLAVDAGAQFVVSPGLSTAVVRRCQQRDVPVFPGVATPSDLISAMELGIEVTKLFPAAQLGGPGMVAALSAPFPTMRFIPTGGITAATAASYLQHKAVLAIGGSWMVPKDLIEERAWDDVSRLTREAVLLVDGMENHR